MTDRLNHINPRLNESVRAGYELWFRQLQQTNTRLNKFIRAGITKILLIGAGLQTWAIPLLRPPLVTNYHRSGDLRQLKAVKDDN